MEMNNDMLLKEIRSPGNVQCGHIRLNNGQLMPRLGMGTWYLGEFMKTRKEEIEALRTGLDIGMNLIDTAEMYGNGLSEQLIGQAISGYDREKIFLVSKVCPHHAGREKIWRSIRHSLRFLRTDYLDLYLLHWRGMLSLQETVECGELLLLAFVLQQENVTAIPRSSDKKHILENREAYDIKLEAEDLEKLNSRFPAPMWKVPLEIV